MDVDQTNLGPQPDRVPDIYRMTRVKGSLSLYHEPISSEQHGRVQTLQIQLKIDFQR